MNTYSVTLQYRVEAETADEAQQAALANNPTISAEHIRVSRIPALGDAVAAIATPIARVLGLPCIDPKTKDLRPESGCAKRKARLNALTRPK